MTSLSKTHSDAVVGAARRFLDPIDIAMLIYRTLVNFAAASANPPPVARCVKGT
jgi:F420-dependent methylenetetrahydromethanopterin dehydrogenase